MVDPTFRVGLVDGNDLEERTRGVADLGVKRTSFDGEAQEKTGGTVLVGRVILNDLRSCDGFAKLLHCDVADNRLIDSVLGELEFVTLELRFDGIEIDH
jgi:hypothetical protein